MREENVLEEINKDFEVILKGKASGIYDVTKYRSKSTGLEVVLAHVDGPIVNGYICLATRAEDDDGLPHTLEHLIFLGSEKYPYKGVLDILANKCLASGTNAWTDVDHTCYTLTTAGSEGFCRLLPIYMDHIFHPILSDEAFLTEVYHTTGEGKDAGVVYSEIQGSENSGEEKSHTEIARTIYPSSSGYHYQTGGVMKNLRESCDNKKVRNFHKKFYNPRNTALIVCGMIEPEKLFQALAPVIQKLKEKGTVTEWKKPWIEEADVNKNNVEKTIYFPADDEEEALVNIGVSGPSAVREIEKVVAFRMLMEYLTDSSASPLQLEFVESDDPLASDVSFLELENSVTAFYLQFASVETDRMKEVPVVLKKVLEKVASHFDMRRMEDVINQYYQEDLSSMENTPHKSIAYSVIGDFLYGHDDQKSFDLRINSAAVIKGCLSYPESYWVDLLKKELIEKEWVIIFAAASQKEHKLLAEAEDKRIAQRKKELGEEGLLELDQKLKRAIEANSKPIPPELLSSLSVPSTKSIHFHSIKRHDNPDWTDFKCNFYLDEIKTNFFYMTVFMDTTQLSFEQRKYLPLLTESLTELPVKMENGSTMQFQEVVAALNKVFVSYSTSLGIDGGSHYKCGSFNQNLTFTCQIEPSKIEPGLDWLRRILWRSFWTKNRLKATCTRMVGDIAPLKRRGDRTASTLLKDLLYNMDSNVRATSYLRQQGFLKDLLDKLPRGEDKIVSALEGIRKVVLKPENMSIHVACNLETMKEKLGIEKLVSLVKQSLPFNPEHKALKRIANENDSSWMRKLAADTCEEYILGMAAEDAGYMYQAMPSLTSPMHEDLPALLATMQYFCQTEGPFYSGIRGAGLAYDVNMDISTSEGLLYLVLYSCSDVISAYKKAQEVVGEHLNGLEMWSEQLVSSAKSSLIFEFIEGEKTPIALASTSLCSYYRKVPEGYTHEMIRKVADVSVEDMMLMTQKYLTPLFLGKTNCSVVCPSDKLEEIKAEFKRCKRDLTPINNMGDSFLCKWQ